LLSQWILIEYIFIYDAFFFFFSPETISHTATMNAGFGNDFYDDLQKNCPPIDDTQKSSSNNCIRLSVNTQIFRGHNQTPIGVTVRTAKLLEDEEDDRKEQAADSDDADNDGALHADKYRRAHDATPHRCCARSQRLAGRAGAAAP
jgi:hypothetical protein